MNVVATHRVTEGLNPQLDSQMYPSQMKPQLRNRERERERVRDKDRARGSWSLTFSMED